MLQVYRKCNHCGAKENALTPSWSHNFVEIRRNGKNSGYLCATCFRSRIENVGAKTRTAHKENEKKRFEYGFEFETSQFRPFMFLYKNGYDCKFDGSVSGDERELVSPVYYRLNSLKRLFTTIDNNIAEFCTVNSVSKDYVFKGCGTHMHLSIDEKYWKNFCQTMRDKSFALSYLVLIENLLLEKESITKRVWGRCIDEDYTQSLYDTYNDYEERTTRFVWVNHSDYKGNKGTVEYRLPLYVNANQYYALIKVCSDLTRKTFDIWKSKYLDNDCPDCLNHCLYGTKEDKETLLKTYIESVNKHFGETIYN